MNFYYIMINFMSIILAKEIRHKNGYGIHIHT